MQCCVRFCENNLENGSNTTVSFHEFPNEQGLRAAWLRALGKQDGFLPQSAVICSQHFLNEDFYKTTNGLKQLRMGAVPSAVQVCLICLETDSKMFSLRKYNLNEAYGNLTGHSLWDEGILKHTLCVECSQRLMNFSQFRNKSLRAHSLMMDLVKKNELVTLRHIKSINREKNHLKSSIAKCPFDSNRSNLFTYEYQGDRQTESDITVENVETVNVKVEPTSEPMMVDDELVLRIKKEKSDDYSNEKNLMLEISPLDETLLAGTERVEEPAGDPLEMKGEPDVLECAYCCEKLPNEDAYDEHMQQCGEFVPMNHIPSVRKKEKLQELTEDPSLDYGESLAPTLNPAHVDNETKEYSTIEKGEQIYVKTVPTNTNNQSLEKPNASVMQVYKIVNKSNSKRKLYSCNQCDYICVEKRNLARHTTTHTGEKPYSCKLCEYKCVEKSKLRRHMAIHTGEKPYSCTQCEYKCAQKWYLVQHMRTHTGEKPYSCTQCDYKCTQKSNLQQHVRAHSGEKPYSCEYCDYKCAEKYAWVKHMRNHTGEKLFSCVSCEYKCVDKYKLERHVKTHTGEKPFSCGMCDYKCARKYVMVKHMRVHNRGRPQSSKSVSLPPTLTHNQKKGYCTIDKRKLIYDKKVKSRKRPSDGSNESNSTVGISEKTKTASLTQAKSHLENQAHKIVNETIEIEKLYSCKLCDYKTIEKRYLGKHMRIHNNKEKPYSCQLCNYRSSERCKLTRHMKTHTGEKPYSCVLCVYKCAQRSNLDHHMRTHTGEKPYSCKLCDYKCTQKWNLMQHIRIHTGEKPYSCKLCHYKCAQKANLAHHMKIHTGEKLYSCELCNYKCARKWYLSQHMKIHADKKRKWSE